MAGLEKATEEGSDDRDMDQGRDNRWLPIADPLHVLTSQVHATIGTCRNRESSMIKPNPTCGGGGYRTVAIKATIAIAALATATTFTTVPVAAHSGGTDRYGCHAGSRPYHCHNRKAPRPTVGRTVPSLQTRTIHRHLMRHCTHLPRDFADGVMGPSTRAAILNFQRSHGLDVDGVVGPRTRRALERRVVTGNCRR